MPRAATALPASVQAVAVGGAVAALFRQSTPTPQSLLMGALAGGLYLARQDLHRERASRDHHLTNLFRAVEAKHAAEGCRCATHRTDSEDGA